MDPVPAGFWERAQTLFAEAMDVSPPERAAFLDTRCDGDARLRREVDSLIAAEARAERFLAAPPTRPEAPLDAAPRDDVGAVIGPFRLSAKIGEGGRCLDSLHRVDLLEAVRVHGLGRIHTADRAAGCEDFARSATIGATLESEVPRMSLGLSERFQDLMKALADDRAAWCGAASAPPAKAP